MKRYIYLAVLLLFAIMNTNAQQVVDEVTGPTKGDFTGSILLGRGRFLQSGLTVPRPVPQNVSGDAPYLSTVSSNDNKITNMIGAEFRYFVSDRIALMISGGAIIRNTPGMTNIPGVTTNSNASSIPEFESIVETNQVDLNVNVGSQYFFLNNYKRVHPYLGLSIPFYYAERSEFDPAINGTEVVDISERRVSLLGVGAQTTAGIDYYFGEAFFLGLEIKTINYVFAKSTKYAGPGFGERSAQTSTISFFSQPFIRIGFKF
ncbi:BT1926 family outer membrane beta-barrel protein [Galbibacter sp.]|uniref:BT1926 family outer membrane beta-barrel protein n=1 Tax=Galbibacter sp. TaxID=2918471 RepID=UPI003A942EFC